MIGMEQKESTFRTTPEKAAARVSVNSVMIGSLFLILTLVFTLSPEKFNTLLMVQMVLAIPFLFVSSLAYAKIGYSGHWKETKVWDGFAWFLNNLGNILILNVIGLLTSTFSRSLAFVYFGLTLGLMLAYSSINIYYKPKSYAEKILKFLCFAVTMFLGGILPLL